jgi:hypothetical protein
MNDPIDFRALLDQIEAHPGTRANRAWTALRRIHGIHVRNHAALVGLIDHVEGDLDLGMQIISDVDSNDVREEFYDELVCRLHNYLASMATLVDHTRTLARGYADSPFSAEYSKRVARLKESGLAPLLQKLRNYLLHARILPVGVRMSAGDGSTDPTFNVTLSRDSVAAIDGMPPAARAYLAQQPNQIAMRTLIEEYEASIEELYRWLYPQFHELHSADIAAVNELIKLTHPRGDTV